MLSETYYLAEDSENNSSKIPRELFNDYFEPIVLLRNGKMAYIILYQDLCS